MRFTALILMLVSCSFSAMSQEQAVPSTPTINRCAPIASRLTAITPFSTPQLFLKSDAGWIEVVPNYLGVDIRLQQYNGGRISFIYVVPPSDVKSRQFLSVRTMADTFEPDNFVNLRRQRQQFDTVYSGTYDDYHLNGATSATLRRFHKWPDGERSDVPQTSREAWAFQDNLPSVRRRVLSLSYTAANRTVCIPFVLGPNIASAGEDVIGDDYFMVIKGFVIEIAEAKNAAGTRGHTFRIYSPSSKVQ